MIKFFRTIRKDLMEKNKTGKYLKYAIGEIVLVVIGILIALSINNWNEERKEKLKEQKILLQMKETLLDDIESKRPFSILETAITSSAIISEHLENKKPYNDSLDYHFGNLPAFTLFMPNMSAYDNLSTIGFDRISNDSLRARYQKIYKFYYKLVGLHSNDTSKKLADDFGQIYLNKFSDYTWLAHAKPVNYEELQSDHYFKELVKHNMQSKSEFLQWRLDTRKEIEEVIKIINQELDSTKQ